MVRPFLPAITSKNMRVYRLTFPRKSEAISSQADSHDGRKETILFTNTFSVIVCNNEE